MLAWGIRTTVVDLVPSVPKMVAYYQPDGAALLRAPNAHVVVDDGRRFLERSAEQFDVILTDPPPPIGAPTSSLLYSEEFYAIVKPHLRPGGILQVWVPGGDDATLSAITKALQHSFPYVRMYESIEGWGIHYFAGMQPLNIPAASELVRKLPPHAAADMVEWNPESSPQQMFADVLDSELDPADYIKPAPRIPAITDDRPINEYFLLRRMRGE